MKLNPLNEFSSAFLDMSSVKYPSWIDGDECLVSYILAVHGYFNEKVRMERRTLKRSL
jgi:hypothetical protein